MRMDSRRRRLACVFTILVLAFLPCADARGQEISGDVPTNSTAPILPHAAPAGSTSGTGAVSVPTFQIPDMTKRENFSAAMQIIILLTVLSLAPAILVMMTGFTRIVIVLSLLRQALGTQQLPPNQILIGLALFMTFLVMGPTWEKVNRDALQPYLNGDLDQKTALSKAQVPLREFMISQVLANHNSEDVIMLYRIAHPDDMKKPIQQWGDVPTMTLVPGFMLSELKTAFLMGFKIYLPFLIIDIVISTVLISMGMMMLPPALISLPFKLLLFVLVDGWHLISEGLISSFFH
jgi:flagellar biosynthesis protein FliP